MKILRITLLAIAALVMVASMGSELEAECFPCPSPGNVYFTGDVEDGQGNPAPDGTIVYAVCDIHNEDCNGHYRVWAEYINNDCKIYSDEIIVDWHCQCVKHVDPVLVLSNIYCW